MADKITGPDWTILNELFWEAVPWGLADIGETFGVFFMVLLMEAFIRHQGLEATKEWLTYLRSYKWGFVGAVIYLLIRSHYALMKAAKDEINRLSATKGKLTAALHTDYNEKQDVIYVGVKVMNERIKLHGVKPKLVDYQGWKTSLPRTFDLAWSNSNIGAIDLGPTEEKVFDIGAIVKSAVTPNVMSIMTYDGNKKVSVDDLGSGQHVMKVRVIADELPNGIEGTVSFKIYRHDMESYVEIIGQEWS